MPNTTTICTFSEGFRGDALEPNVGPYAMAKNTGEGTRKGAVKNRVQIQNPLTGTFIKLDTNNGRIVEQKKSPGPFKGIRILKSTKAH